MCYLSLRRTVSWFNTTRVLTYACLTIDPIDYSLPGSSVHRTFQERIVEWVAVSFSRGPSWPKKRTSSLLHWQWIFFFLLTTELTGKPRSWGRWDWISWVFSWKPWVPLSNTIHVAWLTCSGSLSSLLSSGRKAVANWHVLWRILRSELTWTGDLGKKWGKESEA